MDHLIRTQSEQMCLTGRNLIVATDSDFTTNNESLTVDDIPPTDEDNDHSTSDKNSSTKHLIQLALGEKRKKRARPLKVDFWKHFTKLNSKFALCCHCQRVISYPGTTSNLTRHLRKLHPSVPLKKLPKEIENDIEERNKDTDNSEAKTVSQCNRRAGRRHSEIWNYFTKLADSRVSCNVCQLKFSHKTSTSNLVSHHKKKHSNLNNNVVLLKTLRKQQKIKNDMEEKNEDAGNSKAKTKSQHNRTHKEAPAQSHERRRRSAIWNYFTKSANSHISCNVCERKFSHETFTSNLIRHRRLKHPHLETIVEPRKKPIKQVHVHSMYEHSAARKVPTSDAIMASKTKKRILKRKSPSKMWDFFEKVSDKEALCKECREVITSRPTTYLYEHMRKEHPDTHAEPNPPLKNTASPTILDQDSKILTKGVKLEKDIQIPERVLTADEKKDSLGRMNLKESLVEGKILIKEEIMSEEEEEMDTGGEELKEECVSSPENKQGRLLEFLVPALNSGKYGKLMFWGDEPNVFFIKWKHKMKHGFSAEELAISQDWDALKGRTKAESDLDVVLTRQRLLTALKSQTRRLKSDLEGYKKFKMLHTDCFYKNVSKTQKSVQKKMNVRKQKPRYQDLAYRSQRVDIIKVKPKNRVSRTHGQISYKETSDHEGESDEEKTVPFTLHSRHSKTSSSRTKTVLNDEIKNAFSAAKNNLKCVNPIPKPGFHSLKAKELPSSSTGKRSEVRNVKTGGGGQKFKLGEGIKATSCQVPILPPPSMPVVEAKDENKTKALNTFTNVKTQGEMIEAMIKEALPTLHGDKVSEIYNFLVDMGVENVEDLAFIEVDDLNKILKTVQSRKLIAAWRGKGGLNHSNAPGRTCIPQPLTFAPAVFQIQNIP